MLVKFNIQRIIMHHNMCILRLWCIWLWLWNEIEKEKLVSQRRKYWSWCDVNNYSRQ